MQVTGHVPRRPAVRGGTADAVRDAIVGDHLRILRDLLGEWPPGRGVTAKRRLNDDHRIPIAEDARRDLVRSHPNHRRRYTHVGPSSRYRPMQKSALGITVTVSH